MDKKKLKIMVIGHSRHGKGTVCAMLEQLGYTTTSSSWHACHRWLFEQIQNDVNMPTYNSMEECYADRSNHRNYWKVSIKDFNLQWGLTMLGRSIYDSHNIYDGCRDRQEFDAIKGAQMFDICVWVINPYKTITEEMELSEADSDFILHNDGKLAKLMRRVATMETEILNPLEDKKYE